MLPLPYILYILLCYASLYTSSLLFELETKSITSKAMQYRQDVMQSAIQCNCS